MNLTYYDMYTRHLITRVKKHLNFNSIQRLATKDHILSCGICSEVQYDFQLFTVIKKWRFLVYLHEKLGNLG